MYKPNYNLLLSNPSHFLSIMMKLHFVFKCTLQIEGFNTSIPSRNMFQEKWIWNRRKMRHLHLISPQGLIDRFSSWLVQSFSSWKARTHQCPVITLNFQRECLFLDLLEFSGYQAEIRSSFSLNRMQFGWKNMQNMLIGVVHDPITLICHLGSWKLFFLC